MTERYLEFEDFQNRFGISFGLGIDIEAQYECFQIYSVCGALEADTAATEQTETQRQIQKPEQTWLYNLNTDWGARR